MGGQPRGMQVNFERSNCSLCSIPEVDSPCHVLFECEGISATRELWWNKVINSMPSAMVTCANTMGYTEKLIFILSGLKCERIIPAWSEVMINIGKFVFSSY